MAIKKIADHFSDVGFAEDRAVMTRPQKDDKLAFYPGLLESVVEGLALFNRHERILVPVHNQNRNAVFGDEIQRAGTLRHVLLARDRHASNCWIFRSV